MDPLQSWREEQNYRVLAQLESGACGRLFVNLAEAALDQAHTWADLARQQDLPLPAPLSAAAQNATTHQSPGRVASSSQAIQAKAASRWEPHISMEGWRPEQHLGRSGCPKMAQRKSSVSCAQRTPAGLPPGMPGIGEEMERAIQHAPQ